MLGHYGAGKRQMRDGDLLLIDFAPDYGYYMSDLTRMWPVNGKFSTSQRELYEFYAECYHALLKAIKPGLTAQAVLQFAVREMDGILAKTGLSEQLHNQAAKAFVESFRQSSKNPRAMFGRWVSMSTHDVGQDNGPLRAGMVSTIKPAFQVREERINIRCKDLIVITESEAEILSDFVPLTVDQIEKQMRGNGLPQDYPRTATVEK